MRDLKTAAMGIVVVIAMTGCAAMRDRDWGGCAVAGGVIGATVGGVTGGVAVNNSDNPSNGERAAGIAGGGAAGALLGALLGHVICDPEKAPPPPPPVAKAAPVPGTKLGTVVSEEFDFNKATLKPHHHEDLDIAAKTLKDNPTVKVSAEGYTDGIGSEAYNLKLSERRAMTVKAYLVEHGIEAGRISTVGFGKSKPVADNKTAAGRAKNRRVELIAR
jgi:outer membrane protein OmpA-like peptidoglycan-associated protein